MEPKKRRKIIAMIYLFLANIIILFSACSNLPTVPITRLDNPIPQEIIEYKQEFKEKIYEDIGNPHFQFFEGFSSSVIGLCFMGLNKILVKKSWWDKAKPESRRALIFHEMGHCSCILGHTDDENMFCPESLMNSSLPHNWCLKKYKEKYDSDLKKQCGRPYNKFFNIWERHKK
jgi:hypothetical protein